jgi:hypothetical protein
MKVEENYGLNKFENDYSDVAIDCIFNDDYDDSSDNEEEIYNMLYRNTE